MKIHETLKRGFFCAAGASVFLFATACNGNDVPSGNVDIWSTYNTTKIMREKYDYVKRDASIDVEMAKNEVEGAQIVFTPEYDVKSYDLVLSDLHCGDAVFPKENIDA